MAIVFDNPITAGTVLVRSAIQSQNFVEGVSGWAIEANGNAEFNNLTIPNAGPGQSRTVIYPSGAIISYNYPDNTFVAIFDGQIFYGPTQNPIPGPEADFSHSGVLRYIGGGNPQVLMSSPTTTAHPNAITFAMTPGSSSTDAVTQLFPSNSGPMHTDITGQLNVFGHINTNGNTFVNDVYAANIKASNFNITTIANQWVEQAVLFGTPFTAGVPTVALMGQSGAPSVGGSTTLDYAVTAVTTSGFTARVMRSSAITMSIGYIATWTPF